MVNFPKLHGMNKEMIEQERDRKEIVFRDSRRDREVEKRTSYDGYKMNQIVKNAREGFIIWKTLSKSSINEANGKRPLYSSNENIKIINFK